MSQRSDEARARRLRRDLKKCARRRRRRDRRRRAQFRTWFRGYLRSEPPLRTADDFIPFWEKPPFKWPDGCQ